MTDDLEGKRTRNRIFELRREIENQRFAGPMASSTMLGRVIDGGSMPSAAGHYVLVNPGRAGGPPTEGAAFTTHWNTARKIPVLVVGSKVPPPGTILECWAVSGGRWAAEVRGPCHWIFAVFDGCKGLPLPGSVVSLSQGGVEVATGTTTGQVTGITRVSAGSNYSSVPAVSLSGGGGSGAIATADMQISAMVRTSGGSGYADGTYVGLGTFAGGGGSGATFTFTVVGGVIQPGFTLVTRGQGYTSPPTPDFSAAGAGTGASASVTLNVRAFLVAAGGSDYTSAPTVTVTGGGATGIQIATGTAAIAARCSLEVPGGAYDVTVTPPEDSGYAAYSNTYTSVCGGMTTISVDPDADHVCGGICGYGCGILPKTAFLTWSYDPGFDEVDGSGNPIFKTKYPDATLTLGPPFPPYGPVPVYYSEPFDLDVGPAAPGGPHQHVTARYVIACLGPFINWIIQDEDGTWDMVTRYAGGPGTSINPGNHGCTPFYATGGIGACNSGGFCSRWEYHA